MKFREHSQNMTSHKKGNIDTDIVFEIMKTLIEVNFDKVVLVSGDGDYIKCINYLIEKGKFKRILFPNGKKASSLYNKIDNCFKLTLNKDIIKNQINEK